MVSLMVATGDSGVCCKSCLGTMDDGCRFPPLEDGDAPMWRAVVRLQSAGR